MRATQPEQAAQPERAAQPGHLRVADLWPRPAAWDAAVFLGWRGVRYRPFGYPRFSNRIHAGAIGGYYWTPHVKTEAEIGWSSQSRVEVGRPIDYDIPGASYRPTVWTHHTLRDTTVLTVIGLYQFGEDAAFHPNLGIGVELARTRDMATTPRQTFSPGQGKPEVVLVPESQTVIDTQLTVRSVVTGGFKYYATPRVFIRSDLRLAAGHAPATISGRFGVGFDF